MFCTAFWTFDLEKTSEKQINKTALEKLTFYLTIELRPLLFVLPVALRSRPGRPCMVPCRNCAGMATALDSCTGLGRRSTSKVTRTAP